MAYDKTLAVNVGRLATYDILIKDWVCGNFGTNIPNLLFNSDFRAPVNRNGKTVYSENGRCTIDGWILSENIGTNQLTVGDGFIRFPADAGFILSHKLGKYLSNLIINKEVTISCLTTVGMFYTTVTPGSTLGLVDASEISLPGNWSIDIYGNVGDLTLRVFTPTGKISTDQVDIIAIKLELGDSQTLARKNDSGVWEIIAPVNYAYQYAICSEYSPITGEFIGNQNSNTNMLDNWYLLNPVNRQNFSNVTAGVNITPFMDRWVGCRANISLSTDGLNLSWNGTDVDPNSGDKTGYVQQQLRYRYLEGRQYTLSAIIDGELYYATLITPSNTNSGVHSAERGGIKFGLGNLYNGYLGISVITSSTTPRVITAIKCELGSVQTLARKDTNGKWILIDPPHNYEIEYVKCVQYDVTTGEYIGLNAETVNALSTEGGIVNGDIVITKAESPKVALQANSVEAKVVALDASAQLTAGAVNDDNNKASLTLNRETSELKEAVQLERVIDGESTVYNLYGEHNKPTAEDLGIILGGSVEGVQSNLDTHTGNKSNPHEVTAEQVGAEPIGSVSTHNTATDAHNDIRLLITGLTTRLNALANSTDEDLDQMAELVAYIKSNKALIDDITTKKVSVTDVIDNLTTNESTKPLSAAQGVALKALIDGLTKSSVGLSNVNNTSDADKPVSTAQATAIADAKKAGTDAQTNLTGHIGNTSNPHNVTANQIGAVPTSRTVNGKALSNNITLSASDVGAAPEYTYSTTDLTAGESALTTGKLYFVYEQLSSV